MILQVTQRLRAITFVAPGDAEFMPPLSYRQRPAGVFEPADCAEFVRCFRNVGLPAVAGLHPGIRRFFSR
jgi:hypothetical protein